MVRHSKNNTAGSVFTYAERQMTQYGTQSKRLGQDAKRGFDTCYLCLSKAREPIMICAKGHVSCRECVLSSILEQKQSIAREEKKYSEYQESEVSKQQQRQREIDESEIRIHGLREVGLCDKRRKADSEQIDGGKRAKLIEYKGTAAATAGAAVAAVSRDEPRGAGEKALTSFWVPSMAPTTTAIAKPPTLLVQCLASAEPHRLKLKALMEVKFRTTEKGDRLCPSCDRTLLNSSKIDVLSPCGHAICHRCVTTFVLGSGSCFVCQHKIAAKDLIRIDSEGTGFAGAGGQMTATRYDSALQA